MLFVEAGEDCLAGIPSIGGEVAMTLAYAVGVKC